MFTAAVAVALSLEHKGTQLATEYRELKTKFLTFSMIWNLSQIHRFGVSILSNYVSSLVRTGLGPWLSKFI
ncbi:hypothetical protein YC2023_005997 [Brassica napus]